MSAVPPPFQVRTEPGPPPTIALAGELDIAGLDEVRDAVRDLGEPEALRLSLAELEFIDSQGLRLVLSVVEDTERRGARAEVVRGPAAVQRVFELSGVADRLPFVDG